MLPSMRTSRSWTSWKLRDRPAELFPAARVGQRVLVGAARAADRHPGDPGARHAQHLGRVGERVRVLQPVRLRHPHILEGDDGVLHDPQRDLVLQLGRRRTPGCPFSTMNPLTWPSATSRAQITVRSPNVALPIHFFCPLRIHSSPSRRAVVSTRATRPTRRRARSARTRRSSRSAPSPADSAALLLGAAQVDRAHRQTAVHPAERGDRRVGARRVPSRPCRRAGSSGPGQPNPWYGRPPMPSAPNPGTISNGKRALGPVLQHNRLDLCGHEVVHARPGCFVRRRPAAARRRRSRTCRPRWQRGYWAPSVTGATISRRTTLPVGPFGRLSTNQTRRGYL